MIGKWLGGIVLFILVLVMAIMLWPVFIVVDVILFAALLMSGNVDAVRIGKEM